MEKNIEQKQAYQCDICGATSDNSQTCCGQPMKKTNNSFSQNKTEGFYRESGIRKGSKKKSKGVDVSRFVNEENPNTQGTNSKEKQDQNMENPEQRDDLS